MREACLACAAGTYRPGKLAGKRKSIVVAASVARTFFLTNFFLHVRDDTEIHEVTEICALESRHS